MDHLQNVMGYFDQQQPLCAEHDRISKDLYKEFGVKAGLRDENGKGVLAGLTNMTFKRYMTIIILCKPITLVIYTYGLTYIIDYFWKMV